MLGQTLFLIAVTALLAASALAGVAGVARVRTAAAAQALIVPSVETALARYERYVATTIAAQAAVVGDPLTAAPAPLAALNGTFAWQGQQNTDAPAASAPLSIATSVVPTALVPQCARSSGPDVAVALQCAPFVQESRLSLTITSSVGPADAGGTVSPLAQSRTIVTLRLFAQPPYAALAGMKLAAAPAAYHEGDTGGFGNALGAFASPPPDDTTIHVTYGCSDGSGSCAVSQPPPQDAPAATPWTDGNGSP